MREPLIGICYVFAGALLAFVADYINDLREDRAKLKRIEKYKDSL